MCSQAYGVFFLLLVQETFAISVVGQICMGTVFVLTKQAVQECYVGLSHNDLRLFRSEPPTHLHLPCMRPRAVVHVLCRRSAQSAFRWCLFGANAELQFLGSCTFNVCMAAGSITSVLVYERVGVTAPFYLAAGLCGGWSVCVSVYFLRRYRGRLGLSFVEVEAALLAEMMPRPTPKRAP